VCGDGGYREYGQGRGQDPPSTARVEAPERDRSRLLSIAKDHPGDEEAGDDEEHIDADEATPWPPDEMVGDDGDHREGAKSLDVGAHGIGSAPICERQIRR
jgi:hypothetical protein